MHVSTIKNGKVVRHRNTCDIAAWLRALGLELGKRATLPLHGHVRATKDLDVWIRPTVDNAARAFEALKAYGAPLDDLDATDLATPGTVLAHFGGVPTAVLSRHHLIVNKKASGRLQDLADVERLESGEDS